MKKLIVIFLTSLFLLTSCNTFERQQGGETEVRGQMGSAKVEQPENAKDGAYLDYNEDGVKIPVKKDDVVEIDVIKEKNGDSETKIVYKPANESQVEVSSIKAESNTGGSHKDIVGELDVFLKNSKSIMWIGIGFLVAGGIFGGLLKDARTGLVLGGIGALMLGAYAILPAVYSSGSLIVILGLGIIPVLWWLDSKKHKRIAAASQKVHNKLKELNPELAKEHAKDFKAHLHPKDIEYMRELDKNQK
jgi:hypothetical protein